MLRESNALHWPPLAAPAAAPWCPDLVKKNREVITKSVGPIQLARDEADRLHGEMVEKLKANPQLDKRPYFEAVVQALQLDVDFKYNLVVCLQAESMAAGPIYAKYQDEYDEIVEGARRELQLQPGDSVPVQYLQSLPAWWTAKRALATAPQPNAEPAQRQEANLQTTRAMLLKYKGLICGEEHRLVEVARAEAKAQAKRAPSDSERAAQKVSAEGRVRLVAAQSLLTAK